MDKTPRPATIKDLKQVIKSLNDNKVDYLLIGGYAMQAHGYIRTTNRYRYPCACKQEDW